MNPGDTFLKSVMTATHLQQDSFQPAEWANLAWSLAWFSRHSRALRYVYAQFSSTLSLLWLGEHFNHDPTPAVKHENMSIAVHHMYLDHSGL